MDRLFNTPFETGLRAMLILYSTNTRGMSIDRIVAYDFMTIYGDEFGVSETSLHGSNQFNFSEYPSKRDIFSEGVKRLVLDGLIGVSRSKRGFLYFLTQAGKKYVASLDSDYKNQYLDILENVKSKYHSTTDVKLAMVINNAAVHALQGGFNE